MKSITRTPPASTVAAAPKPPAATTAPKPETSNTSPSSDTKTALTIDSLLKMSAAELEAISDKELADRLSHIFPLVRNPAQLSGKPERLAQTKSREQDKSLDKDLARAQQLLNLLG